MGIKKITLEIENLTAENLEKILKHFNNNNTEAYFKRRNDLIYIIVTPKENLNNHCKDCGVKHFNNREEYIEWLKKQNDRNKI